MRISPFMELPPAYRMTSVVQSPSTADLFMSSLTAAPRTGSQKKYLVCCLICGSFSCLLGAMFLGIYFLIRSYTFNGYFETVPTYVPAALLIVTGLFIVSFARRKYRYSCLIYFSGVTSATSALTCAAVTVTTKVLHMSRLQDLNLNCEYKITTRICTCYSDFEDGPNEVRKLLFDAATDCRVAQGDLYSCLQAIFGLSMAGVLVAVVSCMLSYLLYSHERKKMYWEQLDMRCRLMHAIHFAGGVGRQSITLPASIITNNSQGNTPSCVSCCEQCHATQQAVNVNSISDYPYAPIEFPWANFTNANCGNSKFLTIAGNNNHIHHQHNAHNHHHHLHHLGNFFNQNFSTQTTQASNNPAIDTLTFTTSSPCNINCNNNNGNLTTIVSDEYVNYNNNNNNNNNNNTTTATVESTATNCNNNNSSSNNGSSNSNNNNNNNNNNIRGWRWPRMPWQRNFDFHLFQQALLSRPGSLSPGLDFHSWPDFMSATTPTAQYSTSNYFNGYPIGMWGPPPPPYSDPNSPNWRTGNTCNNNNIDDNQCNEISNLRTSPDGINIFSPQSDYVGLQPPEYSAEPLSIVSPSLNHNENNNNSIGNNNLTQDTK